MISKKGVGDYIERSEHPDGYTNIPLIRNNLRYYLFGEYTIKPPPIFYKNFPKIFKRHLGLFRNRRLCFRNLVEGYFVYNNLFTINELLPRSGLKGGGEIGSFFPKNYFSVMWGIIPPYMTK
jgi:hypothetical protein